MMRRTFARILNLLFYPAKEWKRIAEENNSRKTVYTQFVAPLLCLMAVATIVGTWFNASREIYSAGYVICRIAFLLSSLSASLYFSSFVLTEILAPQMESREHNRDFALMAYSSGAAYLVIIIVELFSFLSELYVLAFYSCYQYWMGIQYFIRAEGQKRMIYGVLAFIIVTFTYLLIFFFFSKIFESILTINH